MTVEEAISDLPSLQNGEMLEEAPYTKSLEETSEYAQQMRQAA